MNLIGRLRNISILFLFIFILFSFGTSNVFASPYEVAPIDLNTASPDDIAAYQERIRAAQNRLYDDNGGVGGVRGNDELKAQRDLLETQSRAANSALQSSTSQSAGGGNEEGEEKDGFWWNNVVKPILHGMINVAGAVMIFIAAILEFIVSIVVTLALTLFDTVMLLSVQSFPEFFKGSAIESAWELLRDLSNIGLIFVLLWIAINTVLQSSSFDTKKLLSKTIVVALLINFSFFFATLIVDISNAMALELYGSAQERAQNANASTVGNYFFNRLGTGIIISTLTENGNVSGDNLFSLVIPTLTAEVDENENFVAIKYVGGAFVALIFGVVVAVVFAIAAIMLVTRLLILIILIITSPIGFVGNILPQTKKMADDWWSGIISQAFFLPIFLLFVWIAMLLGEAYVTGSSIFDVSSSDLGGGATGLLASNVAQLAPVVLKYMIMLGFLLTALFAAKKLSTSGGALVSQVSGKITSTVGNGVFGGAGYIGRSTLGRGANSLANSRRFQELASRNPLLAGNALKLTRGIAGSSFDARGAKAFKGVASATGFGKDEFGETGGKDGYRGTLKRQSDKKAKFAKEAFTASESAEETEKKAKKTDEYKEMERQRIQLESAKKIPGISADALKKRQEEFDKAEAAYNKKASSISQDSVKELKETYAERITDVPRIPGTKIPLGVKLPKGFKKSKVATALTLGLNQKIDRAGVTGFWVGNKNKEAAKKIIKEANKGKDQKNIDALKEALKD